jgi:hypothetical protein
MTKKTKGLEGGRESREKGDTSSSCSEPPIIITSHHPGSGVIGLGSTLVVRVVLTVIGTGMNLIIILTASCVVVAVAVLVLALGFVVAFVAVLVIFLVSVTVCTLILVLAFVVALLFVVLSVLVVFAMMVIILVSVTVVGVTKTPGMTAAVEEEEKEEEGVKVALKVSKLGRYTSIPACSRVRSLPQHSSCRPQGSIVKIWSGSLRMRSARLMSFVHLAALFACPAKGDLSDVAYGVQEPSRLVPVKLR